MKPQNFASCRIKDGSECFYISNLYVNFTCHHTIFFRASNLIARGENILLKHSRTLPKVHCSLTCSGFAQSLASVNKYASTIANIRFACISKTCLSIGVWVLCKIQNVVLDSLRNNLYNLLLKIIIISFISSSRHFRMTLFRVALILCIVPAVIAFNNDKSR